MEMRQHDMLPLMRVGAASKAPTMGARRKELAAISGPEWAPLDV
jgi:hypothetical protein